MNIESKWYIRIFLLFTLVCIFGVGVVYLEHQKRELFSDYQNLIKERDAVQIEWKKLQIQSSESFSAVENAPTPEQIPTRGASDGVHDVYFDSAAYLGASPMKHY